MVTIPRIGVRTGVRVLGNSEAEEVFDEYESELSTVSDDPVFRGRGFPSSWTDPECSYCGMWFSHTGIEAHEKRCPVRESDELDYESVSRVTSKCAFCGYWHPIHRLDCPRVLKAGYEDHPEEMGRWPVLLKE